MQRFSTQTFDRRPGAGRRGVFGAMFMLGLFVLLLPVLLLVVALVGAWMEGRGSPWPFGIGRVISNTFAAIGGAPLALFAASFVLNAPPQLAAPLMAQGVAQGGTLNALGWAIAPLGLVWLLVYPFATLFMTGLALDALAERPADAGATLRMALRRTLPALGLIVLTGIAVAAGFLLFVVPGILLLLTWFVIVPVMAAEGRGIFDCFARSGELLRGMRWRLLLLVIIVGFLWLVFAGLGQALGFAIGGDDGLWAQAAVQAVFGTLTGVLPATGTAAVYHEARTAKEGMGSHDLETVFA